MKKPSCSHGPILTRPKKALTHNNINLPIGFAWEISKPNTPKKNAYSNIN